MIAALAILALQTAPNLVVVPVPDATDVTVQALVRIPKLNDAERLCLRAGWDTLLEGSLRYTKPTLKAYMQQTGKPVVARVLGDHLFLRVSFPPNQLATATSMVSNLLREPAFDLENLEKTLADLREPKTDAWSAALDPERWREAKPTRAEIFTTFRKVVRPENVTIAFGGAVDANVARAQMAIFEDWKPTPERGFVRSWAAIPAIALKSPDSVGIVELFGPAISATDPSFPVHLLASAALGVGRASAVFRFAREEQAWSYRQEGFLQPAADGFRMRLIFANASSSELHAMIDPFRSGMLKQIDAWGQADRMRALESLRSYFEAGIGTSPIRLIPEGSPIATIEERTHLAAWWKLKFGEDFQPARLLERIEKVSIAQLKETAKSTLEQSSARLLVATP